MKILIAGDFVINKKYNSTNIDSDVVTLFSESDFNIVNLEAPVTSSNEKIIKTGPHLKSNEESTLDILKGLKIDLVTLANNHVLDYDQKGVIDTLKFCKKNEIKTVGGGKNKDEASKVFYLDSPEGRIAIINISENEWASATEETAGANGMDLISDLAKIKEAKEHSDWLFVIVHGGHEYYNLPSPRMQEQYRFYVDNGADLVVGHHTHCLSGDEVYKGKRIYYSLGNFLFTAPSKFEDWYKGIVLEVQITNGILDCVAHYIQQSKENFSLSFLKEDELELTLKSLTSYNKIIQDKFLLQKEWNLYVDEKYKMYLTYWSAGSFIGNKYLKALFSKLGINLFNKKGVALYSNLMRCEAHADLSKAVTKKYLSKK